MAASLLEVALKSGVSLATASRALNGKGGVKSETRERVLAVAHELQYAASMVARGLVTAQTETISYVVHQRHVPFDVDFYPIIMHGVEAELGRQGYHLLLTTINDEQLKDASTFKPVAENRVDGIILAGPDLAPRFILELKQLGIPVLLVDNTLDTIPTDSVNNDDRQGGCIATEHLIGHGHRAIAALLGPRAWASSARRGQGYREAMEAAGLEPILLHAEATTAETGKSLMEMALATYPHLTAIFTANDAMAFGAMRALSRQNRRVPEDIAIIGFDDVRFSAIIEPPLSTVKVFTYEIGKLAARRILDMISDPGGPAVQTLLATTLISRRSCGCQNVH